MQTVLIVIHLMVVLALVGVVLLQKSEGGGLGMGGGGGFMSSRGTANVLTRTTAILAAVFFATSLALSVLAGYSREPKSILDTGRRRPGRRHRHRPKARAFSTRSSRRDRRSRRSRAERPRIVRRLSKFIRQAALPLAKTRWAG